MLTIHFYLLPILVSNDLEWICQEFIKLANWIFWLSLDHLCKRTLKFLLYVYIMFKNLCIGAHIKRTERLGVVSFLNLLSRGNWVLWNTSSSADTGHCWLHPGTCFSRRTDSSLRWCAAISGAVFIMLGDQFCLLFLSGIFSTIFYFCWDWEVLFWILRRFNIQI